jgi:hypothetical protein
MDKAGQNLSKACVQALVKRAKFHKPKWIHGKKPAAETQAPGIECSAGDNTERGHCFANVPSLPPMPRQDPQRRPLPGAKAIRELLRSSVKSGYGVVQRRIFFWRRLWIAEWRNKGFFGRFSWVLQRWRRWIFDGGRLGISRLRLRIVWS